MQFEYFLNNFIESVCKWAARKSCKKKKQNVQTFCMIYGGCLRNCCAPCVCCCFELDVEADHTFKWMRKQLGCEPCEVHQSRAENALNYAANLRICSLTQQFPHNDCTQRKSTVNGLTAISAIWAIWAVT